MYYVRDLHTSFLDAKLHVGEDNRKLFADGLSIVPRKILGALGAKQPTALPVSWRAPRLFAECCSRHGAYVRDFDSMTNPHHSNERDLQCTRSLTSRGLSDQDAVDPRK
jgi:hypothetical protein